MSTIYISLKAHSRLQNYLEDKGHVIQGWITRNIIDKDLSCHPDMFMCKMGVAPDSHMIFSSPTDFANLPIRRIVEYPKSIAFNAACTGKYFIHNLAYTNMRLISTARHLNMSLINVHQGYTKCSVVVVDQNSIITYDKGIAMACAPYAPGNGPQSGPVGSGVSDDGATSAAGLSVLLVSPGHVKLPGYDTGLIGGASGRIGDEVIFNGNLAAHPDFERIKNFIEARGLKCVWFEGYPLTDIGSFFEFT